MFKANNTITITVLPNDAFIVFLTNTTFASRQDRMKHDDTLEKLIILKRNVKPRSVDNFSLNSLCECT